MAEPRSHSALFYIAVSIFALAILAGVTRFSCSGSPDSADKPIADSEQSGAPPASSRASAPASPQTVENAGAVADPQGLARDSRQLSADVKLTSEQEERAKALYRTEEEWSADYRAALDALQQLDKAPLENRDRRTKRRARRRLQALWRSRPAGADFLPEPSDEQGQPVEATRLRPLQDRLNDADLSDEQRQGIADFPKTRRIWQVRNRLELRALREQLTDARLAGDAIAEQEAEQALEELTATRPTLNEILSEQTDE